MGKKDITKGQHAEGAQEGSAPRDGVGSAVGSRAASAEGGNAEYPGVESEIGAEAMMSGGVAGHVFVDSDPAGRETEDANVLEIADNGDGAGAMDDPDNSVNYPVEDAETVDAREGKYDRLTGESGGRFKLTGMYKDWFLDYASYVILERAVPHAEDGLKPVHRRILHAMKRLDDGRYNKVANIIGHTMQFHPHGDASIGDALVQLGQKDLLIDCQGNWGNILTGDEAAAPRYIEARLSKFALEVAYNIKTTEWMLSYDGRNQEPVTLPVKFPLLLAHGVEGIAVGLASKILPHNFNELLDACIAHLKGQDFELYPDFPTGGMLDVSRYNDGLRGGVVKARAKISKVDRKTLSITEIPYGTTTESIKESIIKANDKGKIKIRKVDDNTAEKVEILIHVSNDESSDKTIDALYAFTDCEVSISPNSCVIYEDRPHFLGVKEILRRSAQHTKYLLGRELEIRLDELNEDWHMSSLEKIFIENRIYQLIEGSRTREEAYAAVDGGLEPFKKLLRREVTPEDIVKLTELRFIRISRFDSVKADEHIKGVEDEMEQVKHDLAHLTDYAVAYYRRIKAKYGKGRERRTELRGFDTIEAAKVVVANAKLYVDREEGFFGIGKSMRDNEFVCECSDMDDVIVITKEGKYIITRVSDKAFFARNILYIGIFKRNDERTIYNVLYRDGRNGPIMMKRCAIKGITRDKEYDLTKGTLRSDILYMSVNPNGEAEVLKVYFRPRPRLKKLIVDLDFSQLAIKGRQSQGNLFSRYGIQKIVLKEAGTSTLGGQNIWYDDEVRRLNADGRGILLGEFAGNDKILVMTLRGTYYTAGFDLGHHFPDDTMRTEKYEAQRIYSVAYYDAGQKYYYLKRFSAEQTDKMQNFIDEDNPQSRMVAVTDDFAPVLKVTYAGTYAGRPADLIDVEEFIGIKSHRAKGKRITTYEVGKLEFAEPRLADNPQRVKQAEERTAGENTADNGPYEQSAQEADGGHDGQEATATRDELEGEVRYPASDDVPKVESGDHNTDNRTRGRSGAAGFVEEHDSTADGDDLSKAGQSDIAGSPRTLKKNAGTAGRSRSMSHNVEDQAVVDGFSETGSSTANGISGTGAIAVDTKNSGLTVSPTALTVEHSQKEAHGDADAKKKDGGHHAPEYADAASANMVGGTASDTAKPETDKLDTAKSEAQPAVRPAARPEIPTGVDSPTSGSRDGISPTNPQSEDDVEFTIERAAGDETRPPDSEQLDLF